LCFWQELDKLLLQQLKQRPQKAAEGVFRGKGIQTPTKSVEGLKNDFRAFGEQVAFCSQA
jgi:hypothetical protein